MRRGTAALLLSVLLVLSGASALAQTGASNAEGQVKDKDGNPLKDAVVTFVPVSNPTFSYTAKTSKKGRYFVSGMLAGQGSNDFRVTVELEGWVPVEITMEVRTVNRVLVGDPFTKRLRPGASPSELMIPRMGTAKVDFVMATQEEVQQEQQAQAEAAAAAAAASAAPQRKDPWDVALQRAAEGDLEGSIEFFEKAIEEEPEDAERHSALAKVLYQTDRLDEAETHARTAVELNPQDVDAYMALYSVYMAKGELDLAKQALEETRNVAPNDVRVLKQLAFVASETGNTEDAIAAWEAVSELDPEDTEAWLNLGDLYAGAGDSARSQEAYQKVSELDPANAHQIFYNLGALIMNRSDRSDAETRKAIDAFRKAVEIKPDYAQAHKQLAFALLGVGDRSGAKQALEQYVKYAPDAPDAGRMQALIQTLEK
jgi:Flp pilus assembly protein TadD